MKTWTFTVSEPLMGFVVHARPWSKTGKRYAMFKARVRALANLANVPDEIPEGHYAIVSLAIAWKRKARVDTSNILKSIEDGLWVRDRGIGEVHAVKWQHTGLERVSITIGIEREENQRGITSKNRKQDP